MSYHYLFKYIIIGNSGVGKSCILLQFTDNRFDSRNESTIGVEFGTKTIQLKSKPVPKTVKLQIWDTAGQENFRSIARSYYRGSACVFLVYDITRRASFQACSDWLRDALAHCNKLDLERQRQVSYEEGERFAKQNNLAFFVETSAKTAEKVESAFLHSAQMILNKIEMGELTIDDTHGSTGVKSGDLNKQKKRGSTDVVHVDQISSGSGTKCC